MTLLASPLLHSALIAALLASPQQQGAQQMAACTNQYRCYGVVTNLLKAHRPADALSTLETMDARGYEINPSLFEDGFPEIATFLRTNRFRSSPLGHKIQSLEDASDARRRKFQQQLKALPPNQKPPENYVAKNACPFECCRFGIWNVADDTPLVASPESTRVVATARRGTKIQAVTGEVHLRPEPVVVLHAMPGLPANSVVFVLDYLGEGNGHVYSNGRIVQTEVSYARYCFRPSESCWGETLLPAGSGTNAVWWVKVRLPNGAVGWTTETSHFTGQDSCA